MLKGLHAHLCLIDTNEGEALWQKEDGGRAGSGVLQMWSLLCLRIVD